MSNEDKKKLIEKLQLEYNYTKKHAKEYIKEMQK